VIFQDLFGVSMVLPLILPHAREMGASPTMAGFLGRSVYGGVQLFSGPIIGNWSDSFDRRLSIVVVLFFSAIGYGLLGMSSSMLMLFLSRFPSGFFKHSQALSKSYLADIMPNSDRNTVLGHFNAVSSMGFIIGPMIGGHIAEWPNGFNIVGISAAFIFFLNSLIIWTLLPPVKSYTHPELTRNDSVISLRKLNSDEINFSPRLFLNSIKKIDWKDLWDWFLIKFLLGFSVIVFRSNFSLMVKESFDIGAKTNGYLISYSALSSTVIGVFVGRISNFYKNDYKLIKHMTFLLTFTLIFLILSPNIWFLLILLPFLSLSTAVIRVATVTLTLERAKNHGVGALMGLQQSIMAIARMLGSFIAGISLEFSHSGPGILSIIFCTVGLILLVVRPQDVASRRKKMQ
ncbi:hypothetical protein LOTGIDRAFT_144808, partial [Lottia gigantea]